MTGPNAQRKIAIPVTPIDTCWQRIGVWGDRSCPELQAVTHCHNCPVFAAAGRRFLDAPSPPNYLDDWTARLAAHEFDNASDERGTLVFRLGDEWLALPVGVLVEVTRPRVAHRIPHRGGLLAGVVNIRGELHLCIHLNRLLGVGPANADARDNPRLIAVRRDAESWVFSADEVDQVYRFSSQQLRPAAPTLARATAKLTCGVFDAGRDRQVGLLDEVRLFDALRERIK